MKGALDSNRRPHEYMLKKTKERERERLPEGVNGAPSMRTASDGDHHGAVTDIAVVTHLKVWSALTDGCPPRTLHYAQPPCNVMSCGSCTWSQLLGTTDEGCHAGTQD